MKYFFDGVHLMVGRGQALADLHVIARSIGLQRRWFQDKPGLPHYDVWGAPAKKLSVNCTARKMVERCRR